VRILWLEWLFEQRANTTSSLICPLPAALPKGCNWTIPIVFVTACGAVRRIPSLGDENVLLSFDHLVGAREQRRRHVNSERLGSLHIDDQFEMGWLFDR
jgi:hypothetical protein